MKKKNKLNLLVDTLAEQLEKLNIGEVEKVQMSDKSCYYIVVQKDDFSIHFTFNEKGTKIERLGIYETVVETTKDVLIFGK